MTLSGLNSRRTFFKAALASMGACAVWLMGILSKRDAVLPENTATTLTVPLSTGDSIRFYDQAIVISAKGQLAVFSCICPHLGCHINSAEGNELVCPCHGSRFNLHGEVLHGPARHGLQPLTFETDHAASILRITLKQ